MVGDGFRVFPSDQAVAAWANAAHSVATRLLSDPDTRNAQLRHGQTWFVGVDALPNAHDGSLEGVALTGPWDHHLVPPAEWHRAQLSVVYPGYPKQDPDESDGNHRYRIKRYAAHVDGLLPVGPTRRRYLQEPHAFILGLPLNASGAAPLMVWPGSHRVMRAAFQDAVGFQDPCAVDLTEVYQNARVRCFESIDPVPVDIAPGQAVLLHRHLLHGVAPWEDGADGPPEGRLVAYFRPQYSAKEWLNED